MQYLHACPSLDAHSNFQPDSSSDPSKRLQRCAFETCNKPSLESFLSSETREDSSRSPAVCSRCSKAFCVTHREPNNHACSTPDLPSATRKKNEAAQALLAKHFPPTARTSSSSTPAVRPTKQPTNPKKAAQLRQVQLMKMRHRAQPADPRDKDKPVPLEQKLFVLVRTETSSEDIPFWFRKITIAGKALDLLSAQLKISGTPTSPLHLVVEAGEESKVLRNDQPLGEQIEDGQILMITK
ncbi:hypothetical protein NLI96_g8277 [Meripilus lineatus]|uniref:AN1-type domain-containing protein n=1 Tax=Meripilus lineatus TaxID=2056292 RepID=A0AAD5UXM6_9APHY|nr:hypothetical protein NLI96_g8277 [Physisporinus lineatus]